MKCITTTRWHAPVFRIALRNKRARRWRLYNDPAGVFSYFLSNSCVMPLWTHAKYFFFPYLLICLDVNIFKACYVSISTRRSLHWYTMAFCSGVLYCIACTRSYRTFSAIPWCFVASETRTEKYAGKLSTELKATLSQPCYLVTIQLCTNWV